MKVMIPISSSVKHVFPPNRVSLFTEHAIKTYTQIEQNVYHQVYFWKSVAPLTSKKCMCSPLDKRHQPNKGVLKV
jgi:hypothetical protein